MRLYFRILAWLRSSMRRQLLLGLLGMGVLFLSFAFAFEILLGRIGESRLSLREEWEELDEALELSRLSESMHAMILRHALRNEIPPSDELEDTQKKFAHKIAELVEYQAEQRVHPEEHQKTELEILGRVRAEYERSSAALERLRGTGDPPSAAALAGIADGFAAVEREISNFGSLSEATMADAISSIKAAQKQSKRALFIWLACFFGLTGIFFVGFGIKFVRPVEELARAVGGLVQRRFKDRLESPRSDELGGLARAFDQMAEQLEHYSSNIEGELQRQHSLASVGRLAAGVAHEINNPLASIAASAEGILRRVDAPENGQSRLSGEDAEYLRHIRDEVYRCKSLTDKLLDLSRKKGVQLAPLDLPSLAGEVIHLLQPQASKKGVTIRVETPPALPLVVGDAHQIKQVLLNLLLNALQAHGIAGAEEPWIRVSFHCGTREAGFAVEDNGEGIAAEDLERLFEPFFTTKEDRSGTGLGLALSYAIVSAHGGRIKAESSGPGRGAAFRVSLPLAQPSESAPPVRPNRSPA